MLKPLMMCLLTLQEENATPRPVRYVDGYPLMAPGVVKIPGNNKNSSSLARVRAKHRLPVLHLGIGQSCLTRRLTIANTFLPTGRRLTRPTLVIESYSGKSKKSKLTFHPNNHQPTQPNNGHRQSKPAPTLDHATSIQHTAINHSILRPPMRH